MTRRANGSREQQANPSPIEGEKLEPIRVVERELTRPDGTTVRVAVPVYPPFELKKRPPPRPAPQRGRRKSSTA